jgi:hypothetical protein
VRKSIFPLLAEAGGMQNVCQAPCFAPLGVRNPFYSWMKWVARTLDTLAHKPATDITNLGSSVYFGSGVKIYCHFQCNSKHDETQWHLKGTGLFNCECVMSNGGIFKTIQLQSLKNLQFIMVMFFFSCWFKVSSSAHFELRILLCQVSKVDLYSVQCLCAIGRW